LTSSRDVAFRGRPPARASGIMGAITPIARRSDRYRSAASLRLSLRHRASARIVDPTPHESHQGSLGNPSQTRSKGRISIRACLLRWAPIIKADEHFPGEESLASKPLFRVESPSNGMAPWPRAAFPIRHRFRDSWRRNERQLSASAIPKADGVDAPRRHRCARVEVLKHH